MMSLYVIFFFILYLWNIKKNRGSLLLKPILGLYLVGSVCGLIMYYFVGPKPLSLSSVGYQLIIIYLSFIPIISYSKVVHNVSTYLDPIIFKKLGWFFIIGGIYALLFYIPSTISVFTTGSLADLRTDSVANGNIFIQFGILSTIANVFSGFYPLYVLLYFYSLCFLKNSKTFNNLLLATSTSNIFHVFSNIGRDGIVLWAFSFVFCYCLFSRYMEVSIKQKINRFLIIVLIFGIGGFFLITLSRFGSGDYGSTKMNPIVESLIDYQGETFYEFGEYFIKIPPSYDIGAVIARFNVSDQSHFEEGYDFLSQFGFQLNSFRGFAVSFYSAMGVWGSILFFWGYALYFSSKLRNRRLALSNMIVLMVVYSIPFHNYYYFIFSSNAGIYYIFGSLLLAAFIRKREVILNS